MELTLQLLAELRLKMFILSTMDYYNAFTHDNYCEGEYFHTRIAGKLPYKMR